VYFVEHGVIEILVVEQNEDSNQSNIVSPSRNGSTERQTDEGNVERVNKISSGGVFGTDAFLLNMQSDQHKIEP
jgi:hypothetical protein